MKSVPARTLLAVGAGTFVLAVALYVVYAAIHPANWTLDPVDLAVYRSGGLIVREVRPDFNPKVYAPLYQWGGYGNLGLKFTYTPFAAVVFAVVSFIPWGWLPHLSVAVNIVALVAALWFTFRGLGYSGRVRAGATLLAAGAVFWTEPVIRTLYLGQVNLVLMALIIWDLTQPDTARSRWWKGFGVGIAAGIKLTPLVFIPYLLLARKYRQAAVATAGFAFTVLVGFIIQRHASVKWWFNGLFFQGGRTGFTAWSGNQSLRAWSPGCPAASRARARSWAVAAVICGVVGLVSAAVLDRHGHQMAGLLAAALTGLLLSPISWDHHWVWIAPAAAVAGHYAVRAGADLALARRRVGRAGRGDHRAVRRLAGQLVERADRPGRVLARRHLAATADRPAHLLPARRPALVRRVPLVRASADDRQRLHPGRPGPAGPAGRGRAAGQAPVPARGRRGGSPPPRRQASQPTGRALCSRGVLAAECKEGPDARHTAVPRRPRRQPAAPARACSRPATTSRPGRLDADELRAVEDEAIRDVVRMQEERRPAVRHRRRVPPHVLAHGLHLPARRHRPGTDEQHRGPLPQRRRATSTSRSAALQVDGRLGLDEHDLRRRLRLPAVDRHRRPTPKLTIPSPSMVHYRGGPAAIDPAVYPDSRTVLDRPVAPPTPSRCRRIAELGCTYLQLDDTSLAYLNDPAQRAELAAQGGDAEHQHERYIRQINAALAGRPDGMTVTTHMCRGNFRSSWAAEGGYDFVAEALFGELDVDGFFLEYDDARSGGFEPLRFVPAGQAGRARPGHHQARRAGDARTTSSGASTRRRSTCRSTSCACRRSAASPPPSRATPSPTTSRSPSCG